MKINACGGSSYKWDMYINSSPKLRDNHGGTYQMIIRAKGGGGPN